VIGGPRFYERAEVKDAVAYLQVLDNPADAVSLLRIANKPKRGIGDTTLSRLVTYADAHGLTLFKALAHPEEAGLGTAAVKAVNGLRNLLDSLGSAAQELEVPELIQAVYDRTGMIEAYEAERTIEARGRIENLEAFVDGAREYEQTVDEPTLSGFLQEISLYSDQDALTGESNVTLMTIHNAKGLEFRAVFLVGLEEEIFPSSRSIEEQGIEEERRLFYVGLTRAQERLTLTHASSRLLWGRTTSNLPSRFVDELPDRHVERERLRPSSWRSYGTPAQTRDIQPRKDHPDLSTGDSVRHGTLGEGVIVRIEAGGMVTVRFAGDGSERKLMLDYAPLEKV
jgi:DNA helicase II / ATP-dependent DNA helicase PcrA